MSDQVEPAQSSGLQTFLETLKGMREAAIEAVNSPGMAPIHAFIRQGADEIAQGLPAFQDSIRPQPEAGQIFEPTPQLITEQMTGRHMDLDLDQ